MLKHWNTSLSGLAVMGTGIFMVCVGQIAPGLAAIGTGIGLVQSADRNKTR